TLVVEEFVWRLTGKDTIYQMITLGEEVQKRGGTALDPVAYKGRFLDLQAHVIADREDDVRGRMCAPDRSLVPGSRALLDDLQARGLTMYLTGGTDASSVKTEAELLDVSRYFNGGIFGTTDDPELFTKRMLVQRIVTPIEGPQLLGFGDGFVEIEEVKLAGGVAVGVATDEPGCRFVDDWEQARADRGGAGLN